MTVTPGVWGVARIAERKSRKDYSELVGDGSRRNAGFWYEAPEGEPVAPLGLKTFLDLNPVALATG